MIPLGAAQWTGSSNQLLPVRSTAGVQGGSGSFSFGAWANLDTLASSQALLLKGSPNGYNLIEYGVFFNTGLGAFQASFSNGTTGATIASPVTLSTGTWYFVLVWYDASGPTINLAVNGTAATPVSWTDGPIAAGAHAVTLGYDATSSSYPFTGRIASAFLIQRVLTGPEKTYLYNSGNGRVSFDLPSFNGGSLVPPSGQGEWWDLDVSGSTRVGAFNGINMTPVDAGGPRTPTFSTSGIPRVLGLSLASLYTLMGPLSGIQGVASTNFTVTPDGLYGGTITPHTTGTGTFSPSTLSWSNTDDAKTFTYTPSSTTGSPHTVTTTSSPTLTDPAGVAYTVTSGTPVFLKVTAPSPIHGVPRVGAAVGSGGTVNIPVTGTYTGTPGGIEVTRDGVTWVTVADNSTGTLTGGVFAGVLPGVPPGVYALRVRVTDDHTVSVGVSPVSAGSFAPRPRQAQSWSVPKKTRVSATVRGNAPQEFPLPRPTTPRAFQGAYARHTQVPRRFRPGGGVLFVPPTVSVTAAGGASLNEIQTVTLTGATGGTFTLTFSGQTTSALAYNAAASTVQTALRALSSINGANVTVAGSAGGPYTVTFVGTLAGANQPAITAAAGSLTGPGTPTVGIVETLRGAAAANAVQVVTPGGGTFQLAVRQGVSKSIPAGATAADVQAAIGAAYSVGVGNLTVAGSPGGPYTVTFVNGLTNTFIPPMQPIRP
jgi:hypothetical protein